MGNKRTTGPDYLDKKLPKKKTKRLVHELENSPETRRLVPKLQESKTRRLVPKLQEAPKTRRLRSANKKK